MNKSVKIYLIFLVIVIIGVVVVDTNSPKPINWSPTYSISDKIPFGLYVFNQELKEILKPDTLQTINVTPYEYFDDYYNYDTLVSTYSTSGTFIAISDYPNIDDQSVQELLYFASQGNSIFFEYENDAANASG